MRVTIAGHNPPGRVCCRPDGSVMDNVHVGVQLGRDPAELARADRAGPLWEVDVNVARASGRPDFRGLAVHGKRGDRFIYLTWGNVGPDNVFEMFRRAKLMLDRVEPHLMEAAIEAGCPSGRGESHGWRWWPAVRSGRPARCRMVGS